MTSLKFTDAKNEKARKLRILAHAINVFMVTFTFTLLLNYVGSEMGVDVNKPLKEYDDYSVSIGLAIMLFGFIALYTISFKILGWIFSRFRI